MQSVSTPTVGILVFRNNFQEVLLTKHKETAKHQTGKYGIPAGRLDPGETEIQALLREFNEETGLETHERYLTKLPFEYSATIQRKDERPRIFTLKVWYCSNYSGTPTETIENIPEWINVNNIHELNLLPNMEKVVKDALDYIKINRNLLISMFESQ